MTAGATIPVTRHLLIRTMINTGIPINIRTVISTTGILNGMITGIHSGMTGEIRIGMTVIAGRLNSSDMK